MEQPDQTNQETNQLDDFFEFLKDNLREFEQFKPDISKNSAMIIAYMSTPGRVAYLLADFKRTNAALYIINYLQSAFYKEENTDTFLALLNLYTTPESTSKFNIVKEISGDLFYLLLKQNRFTEGFELFVRLASYYDRNVFVNVKAFAVYFAYQLKSYEAISSLLNTFFIELRGSFYEDAYDFCMMNFYKGLIFLSKFELYKASICFLSLFKAVPHTNLSVYNHFQINAMKRLALLSHIVDPTYKSNISTVIANHKKMFSIKPFDLYADLNRILKSRTLSNKELDKFHKDNAAKFKTDKTNGLMKLVVKEVALSKIQSAIKAYKRIRLEKFSNMIEMDKNVLVGYLKLFTYQNRLSLKFDEVDEVIEVNDNCFDNKLLVEEMKRLYENVNHVQKELIDVSFKKSEAIEKNKVKNEETKFRAMMMDMQVPGLGVGQRGMTRPSQNMNLNNQSHSQSSSNSNSNSKAIIEEDLN